MVEEEINVDEHIKYLFIAVKKKKKMSLRRECCHYHYSKTFCNIDGVAIGLNFFKFPQKNSEKL